MGPALIFLVDDDVDDQGLFRDALAEIDINFQLVTTSNGVEALKLVHKQPKRIPDYIFMDLNMPKMNGIQCLQEFRKLPDFVKVPIIIYSTSSYARDRNEATKAGATGYMIKPFSFPELCDNIREMLSAFDPK